jgi:hypothetical protein
VIEKKGEVKEGLFLSPEDVEVLFTLLKAREYALSDAEHLVLSKIENSLYACLSVDEVEALLPRNPGGTPEPGPERGGRQ